jgi:hypothetical protein
MLFCVKHLLIICIHFVMLKKYRSITVEEVQWVIAEWPDQWKVPVAIKKGAKGKEWAKASTSQKSSSSKTNTRKATVCTKPIVIGTTKNKPRKKEMVPGASVLGTERTNRKNDRAQKKDNIQT